MSKEESNGNKYYLCYDRHGDVKLLTDLTGTIVKNYSYDIYGKEENSTQNQGIENSIRYAGQYYDSESNLYYLRARYYSPDIMRFISEDTYKGKIENPLSLNYYVYCEGNPVGYIDPSGNGKSQLEEEYEGDDYENIGSGGSAPAGCPPTPASKGTSNGGGNVVYISKNADDVVQYVGITNNFARRAAEHLASKGIQIEKLMERLSRYDARAVEQTLIEINELGKNGGTLINRINSIATSNLKYSNSLARGYELLESIGYE